MKLKKTALAVAIAGFAAAPMMVSADTVLSGVVQLKFQGSDVEDDDTTLDVDESDAGELNIAAGDVRIGVVSEHELNTGLIGYGSLQMNLDNLTGEGGLNQSIQVPQADADGSLTDRSVTDLTSAATVSSDNVYAGIKGGFGDIRIGEIPLGVEYGQLANDIHDVADDVVGGLSYTGTFGPVGLGLNFSPENNSDMFGAGIKFNFAGATIGLGFEDRADTARFAVGASYAIAGVSLAVHYWAGDNDFNPVDVDDGGDDDDAPTTVTFNDVNFDDTTNIAVQAGYSIAGVALGLTYSVLESDAPGDATPSVSDPSILDVAVDSGEETIIRFDAGYDLGGDTEISTRIQNKSDDNDDTDDLVEYRVMLSKSF